MALLGCQACQHEHRRLSNRVTKAVDLLPTVVEINEALEDTPELINQDAFENWIIKVELSDQSDLDNLMDAKAYAAFCEK